MSKLSLAQAAADVSADRPHARSWLLIIEEKYPNRQPRGLNATACRGIQYWNHNTRSTGAGKISIAPVLTAFCCSMLPARK